MKPPEWLSWTAPLWMGIGFFGIVAVCLLMFGLTVKVQRFRGKPFIPVDIDAVREEGM
jgi:hypothetical protein